MRTFFYLKKGYEEMGVMNRGIDMTKIIFTVKKTTAKLKHIRRINKQVLAEYFQII